jgi:ElaB/YqjD/DUF883 family membrane-anchored ribosome-binding protein
MQLRANRMFDSSELGDELQALKGDVSRLLNTTSEGIFGTSRNRAEALADQIKAALNDLGETLSEHEDHVENLTSERPITSLASDDHHQESEEAGSSHRSHGGRRAEMIRATVLASRP